MEIANWATLETFVISLFSGILGAALACIVNLVIQDKREKRRALGEYFKCWRFTGKAENFELLNLVFMSFSRSQAVKKALKEYRETGPVDRSRAKLLKAMCKSAWIKYDEFLMNNDTARR